MLKDVRETGVQETAWEAGSSRYRYNKWPDHGIDETRQNLNSSFEQRLQPLEAGLTWAPSEGVGR